jgi:hypothetical protein
MDVLSAFMPGSIASVKFLTTAEAAGRGNETANPSELSEHRNANTGPGPVNLE